MILDGNEEDARTIGRPWKFSIQLERGRHSVFITSGGEEAEIEYEVQ